MSFNYTFSLLGKCWKCRGKQTIKIYFACYRRAPEMARRGRLQILLRVCERKVMQSLTHEQISPFEKTPSAPSCLAPIPQQTLGNSSPNKPLVQQENRTVSSSEVVPPCISTECVSLLQQGGKYCQRQ